EEFRVEYVADRAETTAEVWLGLTAGCARCHDHKYDPIRQTDYYKFFAYFNNLPELGLVYNYGNDDTQIKAPTPEQETKLAELDERAAVAQDRYQKLQPELAKAQQRWEKWLSASDVPDWFVHDGLVLHYAFDGDLLPQTTGWVSAKATVADVPS